MKYIKPILTPSRILIFLLWFIFIFNIENPNWNLVLIPIVFDVAVRSYFFHQIRKNIKNGSIVFIAHKRFMTSLLMKTATIVVFLALLFYFFYVVEYYDLNVLTIIILGYSVISNYIFYNDYDGYIFNSEGILQPNLFEPNYKWKDISAISILPNSLKLTIKSKEYLTRIAENQPLKLIKYLDSIDRNYSTVLSDEPIQD